MIVCQVLDKDLGNASHYPRLYSAVGLGGTRRESVTAAAVNLKTNWEEGYRSLLGTALEWRIPRLVQLSK
jgi:hypothetical protein